MAVWTSCRPVSDVTGGLVMALIARVLGVSLLTSALVAGLGYALLTMATGGSAAPSEYIIPELFLACVGGVIGAVAGAAREIVAAQRPKAFDPGGEV
jgi:hypothetical protein